MAAVQNCDDRINHPNINPATACAVQRTPCVDGHANHAGAAFSVCNTCAADTAGQAINLFTRQDIPQLARPGLTRANPGSHSFRDPGFRTLLCRACVRREKELRRARHQGTVGPAHLVPWTQRRFMENYPHNTCTCRQRLLRQDRPRHQSHRHCAQCRLDLINEMVNNRNNHEAFLEGIKRNASWNTCTASAPTRRQRDNTGTFRACRCGNTVEGVFGSPPGLPGSGIAAANPAVLPEVYQCLCCKGIIHTVALQVPGNIGNFDPARHNRVFSIPRAQLPQRI